MRREGGGAKRDGSYYLDQCETCRMLSGSWSSPNSSSRPSMKGSSGSVATTSSASASRSMFARMLQRPSSPLPRTLSSIFLFLCSMSRVREWPAGLTRKRFRIPNSSPRLKLYVFFYYMRGLSIKKSLSSHLQSGCQSATPWARPSRISMV